MQRHQKKSICFHYYKSHRITKVTGVTHKEDLVQIQAGPLLAISVSVSPSEPCLAD